MSLYKDSSADHQTTGSLQEYQRRSQIAHCFEQWCGKKVNREVLLVQTLRARRNKKMRRETKEKAEKSK